MPLRERWPAIAGIAVVTAALAFAFRGSLTRTDAAASAALPRPTPKIIAVKERNGATRNLAAPTGRILVVHFWATWCGPCVEEFPGLVAAWRQLEKRKDVDFVTVSVDDAWKTVEPWLKARNASDVPTLLDPTRSAAHAFGTDKFPETWILGPDGSVLAHAAGPLDWKRPEVVKGIEELASALPRRS